MLCITNNSQFKYSFQDGEFTQDADLYDDVIITASANDTESVSCIWSLEKSKVVICFNIETLIMRKDYAIILELSNFPYMLPLTVKSSLKE